MNFQRYAIYFTAPDGPLSDFGAAWLGWDLEPGKQVAHPQLAGLTLDVADITQTPRKYGFHATMKPPFRLKEGHSFEDLRDQAATICSALPRVTLSGLSVSRIGRFLALTPTEDSPQLDALSADVVRAFDPFRAPATEAELARRRAARLTAAQESNLVTWGYPFVMQDFHFHMTLSGKLDQSHIDQVHHALSETLDPLVPVPFEIRDLTLVGEGEDGQFYQIERLPLGAS